MVLFFKTLTNKIPKSIKSTNQKLETSLTFITAKCVWLPKDIKQIGLHKVQILLWPLPTPTAGVDDNLLFCFVGFR